MIKINLIKQKKAKGFKDYGMDTVIIGNQVRHSDYLKNSNDLFKQVDKLINRGLK